MVQRRLGWGSVVTATVWLGLAPAAALADSFVESTAYAESTEYGEDPGDETDQDQTSSSGATAIARTFLCRGPGLCAFDPQNLPDGGRGIANTEVGVNRASALAVSGFDENATNNVVDYSRASSHWVDEWNMLVLPGSVGQAVSIEFTLDGAWGNFGTAVFDAVISDSTKPTPPVNPDDPQEPVVPGGPVAFLNVDSTRDTIFLLDANAQLPFIPFEDGGQADGEIDETFVLSFVPVAGRTYYLGARLAVTAGADGQGDSFADFDGTARLTRVLVPEGVSFTAASGVPYVVVVVPEPGTALLLALGAAALGFAARRRPH